MMVIPEAPVRPYANLEPRNALERWMNMVDDPTNAQELSVARSRESTYRFLSSALITEMTAEFWAAVAQNPPVSEGVLGEYLASLKGADVEAVRSENAVKYAKLLLGASSNPAIPYESPHTSPEHIMRQESWSQVKAIFASSGFTLDESLRLPEDHISFELEFMAVMCKREQELIDSCDAVGLASNRAVQRSFLTDHLLTWVGAFCDDLAWKSRGGFYAGIAETLKQFMAFETEEFDIADEEIKYPKFEDAMQ